MLREFFGHMVKVVDGTFDVRNIAEYVFEFRLTVRHHPGKVSRAYRAGKACACGESLRLVEPEFQCAEAAHRKPGDKGVLAFVRDMEERLHYRRKFLADKLPVFQTARHIGVITPVNVRHDYRYAVLSGITLH
ncbi:hypothetical protein SDC9_208660 [bioreactor metagenome]|uniref:Uncharacterized protein n=1 Tax=bioreactor metagenome TaxID=1076179 RepID=A0A645JC66_9ZZZZ